MSSSSSSPKTSVKFQPAGRPRRWTKGLSTSGDDSSGSHEPMVLMWRRYTPGRLMKALPAKGVFAPLCDCNQT